MATLTNKQQAIIKDNLQSFINNFGAVRIESGCNKDFYVYYPADSDSYIQYCDCIDYLNGWLYGVVQGVMRGEFKPYRTGSPDNKTLWERKLEQEA